MANTTSYYNYLNPNKTSNSSYSPTQSTSSLYGNLLKSTAAGTGLGSILGTVIGSPIIGTALGGLYGATSGLLSGAGSSSSNIQQQSGTNINTQKTTGDTPTYIPSASPTMMTWDAALAQAKSQVDPLYNEQRSQLEQLYRDKAEQAPQLRAARGGLTRLNSYGGIGEEKGEITQDQAAKIDSLENSRQAAISTLASEIQNNEYDNSLQKWQAQEQANYNAYKAAEEQSRNNILDQQTNETNLWNRALALATLQNELDQQQFSNDLDTKKYDLDAKKYSLDSGSYQYSPEWNQTMIDTAKAELNKILYPSSSSSSYSGGRSSSGKSSSGGSGGSGGGLTDNPFGDPNKKPVAYSAERLQAYIDTLRNNLRKTTVTYKWGTPIPTTTEASASQILNYVENADLNPSFKQAVLAYLTT